MIIDDDSSTSKVEYVIYIFSVTSHTCWINCLYHLSGSYKIISCLLMNIFLVHGVAIVKSSNFLLLVKNYVQLNCR